MALHRCFSALVMLSALVACGRPDLPNTGGDAGPRDGGSDAGPHDGGSDAGPAAGSPAAPVLSGTTSFSAVTLSWTPGDAKALNFEILRADNQGAFQPVAQVAASATSYSDTSVAAGSAYAYAVTGSNDAGAGAASNPVQVLAAPATLRAGGSDSSVALTWGAVPNATSYDIYRVPASGAPQRLGSSTAAGYFDDGGSLPISTGSTCAYLVVSRGSGGYLPSIGSNTASTQALGLSVVAQEVFVSDTGEQAENLIPFLTFQVRNVDGGPLFDDAGSPLVYSSFAAPGSAVALVPGVPQGTYAITVEGFADFSIGSARSLDFSQAQMGRAMVATASPGTQLAYNLTGLTAWNAADAGLPDALESISLGARNFAANLASDIPAAPGAGATTFAGVEAVGRDTDPHLVDADAGDAYSLFQLHAQSSGAGAPYLAPVKVLGQIALSMADGASTPVAGALTAITPSAISDFDFPRGAYLDPAHAALNPAAAAFAQRVFVEEEKGYLAHGWYNDLASADALIVDIPQDGGTGDADLGSMSWSSPVASSWDPFVLVQSSYQVPFTVSFVDSSGLTPVNASGTATFTAYSAATVPLDSGTFSNAALALTLSAPTAPQLNGSSAFTAQSSVSRGSRLSWSAPATGAPGYYLVLLYQVTPQQNDDGTYVKDGSGHYLFNIGEAASFNTKDTSVTFPADLVPAGGSFFATIDAVSNSSASGGIDGTVTPYTLGSHYASAETVTALFTTAPESAPSRLASRPALAAERLASTELRWRRARVRHRELPRP